MVRDTTDAEKREIRRLLSSGSPSTASRFAPANAQPSNLEPTPAPSRFRQAASAAGRVGRLALSGKAFAAAALPGVDEEDIENLPWLAEFAIDNLVSPVGLASLALAPVTGGGSIAAKVGLGAALASKPLAVRAGVELGGRIAADLAVAGVATAAAKGVEKVLPEDMDPRLKTLASLATGLVTGVGSSVALSKTIKPAIKGTTALSAIERGDLSLPKLPEITEHAGNLNTMNPFTNRTPLTNPVTRQLMMGINPAQTVRTYLGKLGVARTQLGLSSDQLAKTYVAAHFPSAFSELHLKNGEALVAGKRINWYEAITDKFDDLTEPQKAVTTRWKSAISAVTDEYNAVAPPSKQLEIGEIWRPRYNKKGELLADSDKFREFNDTARALRLTKKELERPDVLLHVYAKTAMTAKLQKQFDDAVVPHLRSSDDVLATTSEGKALKQAWDDAARALEEGKVRTQFVPITPSGRSKVSIGDFGGRKVTRPIDKVAEKSLRSEVEAAKKRLAAGERAKLPLSKLEPLQDRLAKAESSLDSYLARPSFAPRGSSADILPTTSTTKRTPSVSIEGNKSQIQRLQEQEETARKAWQKYKNETVVNEASAKLWGGKDELVPVAKLKGMYAMNDDKGIEELAKWTRHLASGGEPLPGFNELQQVADASRFFQASLDASGPFINLLPLMFSNPGAWAKAIAGNWRALTFDPDLQLRYLAKNYDDVVEMVGQGVAPADIEQFVSAARGGLAHTVLDAKGMGPAKALFGRAQIGYETGLLIGRVEAWKALKANPTFLNADGTPALRRMADFIRETTGAWDSAYAGVAPTQRALESILFFSPRMFRSILALTGDAMRPWTPEGAAAAHAILRMMAAGTGLFAVANAAIGIMEGETEAQVAKRMEESVNPINGRQFLSVKVGDEWYGIGGQVRSMTQALARAISNEDEEAGKDNNPLWDFFSGRLGPGPRSGLQLTEALTGNDWAPYERLESFPDWIDAQAHGFLPFYVQNALSEGGLPGLADPTMIIDIAGLSSKPRSSTDVLDSIAFERHNMPWKDLTGLEQEAITNERPDLVGRSDDLMSDEDRMYKTAVARNDTRTYETLQAVNESNLTQKDKRERIEEVLRDRWLANKTTAEDFNRASGIGAADTPKRQVLDAYYNTFKEAGIGPEGTTQTDWDKWEDLQADLDLRIKAGEFGEPARAQAYIDERRKFKLPPELSWYTEAKEVVKDTQYWEQKDIAFAEISDIITNAFPDVSSARELEQKRDEAEMQGDLFAAKRIEKFINVLNNRTEQKRKLLKLNNPELKVALTALGR